ncbi:MAG TPA: hypothetical protein VK360_06925 [Acidimicrobiales bacterium]|nr:hypothetical protein [Acidimicrobiales bacterium]
MALGLVGVVLAVVTAVVCLKLAVRLQNIRHELDAAHREASASADRMRAAEAERDEAQRQRDELATRATSLAGERGRLLVEHDELQRAHEELSGSHKRLAADHDDLTADHAAVAAWITRERARADAAEAAHAAAESRADELLALVGSGGRSDEAGEAGEDRGGREDASPVDGSAGGAWRIVLSILERHWVGVVGAPPDGRGVVSGPVSDQLAEALTRESERLREEVGVDVEISAASPVDPADPVTFLLAATDLLGVLAAVCERIVLTLDGALVVVGEGWSGPTHELDLARARALAAGTSVDEIAVDGETVSLALRPAAAALTADSTGHGASS